MNVNGWTYIHAMVFVMTLRVHMIVIALEVIKTVVVQKNNAAAQSSLLPHNLL